MAGAVPVAGGRAFVACVSRADYAAAGAAKRRPRASSRRLRSADGVEVAALVKEQSDGPRVRVSLRSSGLDVSAIAGLRGGGGHRQAAGFSSDDDPRGGDRMAQFRTRKALADGILLIDKPEDFTSHDVVARVRGRLKPSVKKVGHAGTLDPFATGLLVVLVGRATKLARFFVDLPKEYECTVRFGVRSDTGDLTGVLSETGCRTTREAVEDVLPQYLGLVMQQVPMTSAVKVDGERLYKKAHRGEMVETPLKEVEIEAIEILDFDEQAQTMRCRIACSKGTYVRQLAIDIGEAVGVGAHLEQLSRTATGELRLDEAQSLATFEESLAAREAGDEHIPGLVAASAALQFLPGIELSAAQVTAVRNGARLPGGPQEPVRLTYRGELVAIYGPAEEGHALKLLVKL